MSLPGLETGVISDLHLLLLVQLTSIDEFLYRARTEEAVDGDITGLSEAVRSVHGLEVMRWIWKKRQLVPTSPGYMLLTPIGIWRQCQLGAE